MNKNYPVTILFLVVILFSCGPDSYTPKPKGFPRMDFPKKEYKVYKSDCAFQFEQGIYTFISNAKSAENPCWINIDYGFLNSRIHFSYKELEGDLSAHIEDARTLVYRHTIKASAINESEYLSNEKRVYARVYELEGNAASSIQFYATDSIKHFVRGALYFNTRTNSDSLRPAIDFIREDVWRLVETLEWTEQ